MFRLWAACVALVVWAPQAQPPSTEVFLAPFEESAGAVTIGPPLNISNSPGYDNQPSFTPDGTAVLFTSGRGEPAAGARAPQTDIYRFDLSTRRLTQLTRTAESEYSPTVTPDGRHFSVIRVEADQTQRLWRFARDGTQPELVLENVKPVGYHVWASPTVLALFILGQPATLQIADTTTGKAEIAATGIGRSLQRVPNGGISFVQRESRQEGSPPTLTVTEIDVQSRKTSPLVPIVGPNDIDTAWTPSGLLLMSRDDSLLGWRRGETSTKPVADLNALGLRGVSRMAISPKGNWIAFVAQPGTAP